MVFSDESGDELQNDNERDYQAIPELDQYDAEMVDDRPCVKSARREMNSRQQAEEMMAARDAQERGGVRDGARRRSEPGSSRGPKALEQVKANRASNVELERLGLAMKCSVAVVSKAEEFLKKAYTGVRCLGNASQVGSLPVACLEIAARACKKPILRDVLMRKAGVQEKDLPSYTRALSHCHCLLGEFAPPYCPPLLPNLSVTICCCHPTTTATETTKEFLAY